MVLLSKEDKKRAERQARRQKRCHDPKKHREKDSVRSRGNASKETKKMYRETVNVFSE